jgi:hypothetical protein
MLWTQKFLERATKTIWERSSKNVNKKDIRPCGTVHIDANIVPSDVLKDLDDATATKIGFNYTGPDALDHPDELELVENILRKSKEAFQFLPVLASLGQSCVLPKISKEMTKGKPHSISSNQNFLPERYCMVLTIYAFQNKHLYS